MTPTVRSSRAAAEPKAPLTPSRPLELVDPDEWRRRRRARIVVGIAVLVVVASPFVIVGMNVQMAQRQIQLQHLRTSLAHEQRQYETLREELLQASSPAGIAQAAQRQGLQAAGSVTVLSVPPTAASDAQSGFDSGGDAALAAAGERFGDDVTRDQLAAAP